ncbi:MAG: potassium channel family protein, partial [Acidimicrobiales bacterium]
MRVIVVGCGRVGSELAIELDRNGHDVAIIDKNARSFRRLPAAWPGHRIVGFGFDRDHLEEAGAKEAGALAAVTSGDNSNVLAARIARETYQIPHVVARIYDPRRAVIYERLGIPTVATVTWTTDQVLRRLIPGTTSIEWSDPSGNVSLVERGLPPAWAGRNLGPLVTDEDVRLVLVLRSGETRVASADLVGQEGDVMLLAVRKDASNKTSPSWPTRSAHATLVSPDRRTSTRRTSSSV